jgi:transcriptional regulator of acetoin/glycerol metabolism
MQPEDLPEAVLPQKKMLDMPNLSDLEWSKAKDEFGRQYLVSLLLKTDGNISTVSSISGIPRENIYRKCKQLDIDPNEFRHKDESQ